MLGYGLLNIGSLLFGLIAWILPVIMIAQRNNVYYRFRVVFPFVSASACAISLFMQIFYTAHLVKIEDWSALMDTSGAVTVVSALLLVVTIILNILALCVEFFRTR
jgi:cytochrome c oxidase subunit 4